MSNSTVCSILGVVQKEVLTPLVSLLLALAAFLFLWGLVEFIAGASSEEARTTGKKHMMWGVIGLVVMLAAAAIITVLENFFASPIPGGPLC